MLRFAQLLLLPLVVFCGCEKAPTTPAGKGTVNVITQIVEQKDAPVTFEYVAEMQSSQLVNIQARVSGFLDNRVYTEGEIVKKDQVLFLMDKKPFQAQVDAAAAALERQKAAFQTAKLNLARVKPLTEQKALSQKDLDDATGAYESMAAAVDEAKAQLEIALLNLSYCTITSPLLGAAAAALQQDGAYINLTDSKLTTVSSLDPIWVNFSVSQNQMLELENQIKKGQLLPPRNQGQDTSIQKGQLAPPKDQGFEVKVILNDGSIFPHTGRITFTEPYYNSQTGTFLIRASLANPDGVLRPNQFVHVSVEGAIRPKAILIPQKAVLQSTKGSFVWVVDKERKASFRPVVLGDWQGSDWFVTEGLINGDEVVIEGGMNLSQGTPVSVKKAN